MRNILLLALGLLMFWGSTAQNEVDLIRLTTFDGFSTTRTAGMAGSFGALGADMSSLNTNPAGLGFYRRGEFSFSGSLDFNASSTELYDTKSNDFSGALRVNSIGYSLTQDSPKEGINKSTFALAFNRLASFNQRFTQEVTHEASILDVFNDQIQGLSVSEFSAYSPAAELAWNTYLLDPDTSTENIPNDYITAITSGDTKQITDVERTGGISELLLGTGAGVDNKVYWGVTLGIPIVQFEETYSHREETLEDIDLDSFNYTEELSVSGVGVNLKLGLLFRPTKWLRIGGAVHTRTTYSLTDTYSTQISSTLSSGPNQGFYGPEFYEGTFNYRIKSPSRYMINCAFIRGKNIVINVDYDQVDYSKGELKPSALDDNGYNFADENQFVRTSLKKAHNIRIGGEMRVNNSIRFRGGVRYMQSAYEKENIFDENLSKPQLTFTAGAGYRREHFFMDAALTYTGGSSSFQAYRDYIDVANVSNGFIQAHISIGSRI